MSKQREEGPASSRPSLAAGVGPSTPPPAANDAAIGIVSVVIAEAVRRREGVTALPSGVVHANVLAAVRTSDRQVKVAQLLLQEGMTYRQIAEQLGCSTTAIAHDVTNIMTLWKSIAVHFADVLIGRELEVLLRVESEAWGAWERSTLEKGAMEVTEWFKSDATKVRGNGYNGSHMHGKNQQPKPDRPTKTHVKYDSSVGDPRYLNIIKDVVQQRCILLGLNQPIKIAPTDPTGEHEYGSGDIPAGRLDRLAALLDSARAARSSSDPGQPKS